MRAITLIPTGLLSLLPLHAAWTPDEDRPTGRRYALDELLFTYAPSATALRELGRRRQDASGFDTLLAVDNPDGTLHYSFLEVQAAREQPGWQRVTHLPKGEATRQAVAEAMREHAVWYFSTHGQAGWTDPLAGRLTLADGPWTAREILDRAWGPGLAVLSACEVGVPGLKLPEEVVGLPTVFVQAGAAGVVATLWAVNEVSTALLMARFWELWREEGLGPAGALRAAQQWLRDSTPEELQAYLRRRTPFEESPAPSPPTKLLSPETAARLEIHLPRHSFGHPHHWAAFTYTGFPRR